VNPAEACQIALIEAFGRPADDSSKMRNSKRRLRFARSKCEARAALRSMQTGQNSIAPENSLPQLGQVRWGSVVTIYPPVLSPRSFDA
jgi:hypothetical protein